MSGFALGIAVGLIAAVVAILILAPGYIRRTRADAITKSRAVVRGQVYEQLVPYLPEFEFNPKDAQFLGKPVDFVVFDGLDEGELRRVVFVEVKTGNSALSARERRIRDAIREGRVEWHELRAGQTLEAPVARRQLRKTR